MQQITNGNWTLLFTNATTTNHFQFTVSAPNMTSNMLPALVVTLPTEGVTLPTTQPTFAWQWPDGWGVNSDAFVVGGGSVVQYASLPEAQHAWYMATPLPVGQNLYLQVRYTTNHPTPLFVAATPINTNTAQPVSGWISTSGLTSIETVDFSVTAAIPPGPALGHTNLAYYSFEDNNLFAHDYSGHNNMLTYAWFGTPPTIVTNAAAAGTYAGGLGGSGWFTPASTNLVAALAGSFSVSLWLKTADVHGNDNDSQYSAAGICSALSGDYANAVMPMGLTGSKLAFYTGGSPQNILHSQAHINTGQYVHAVVTRDQQSGEKRIYLNGVLDSSTVASTSRLTGPAPNGLSIGYNSGQVFTGMLDEIQVYAGVLASNEVAYLYTHPGTNVADTVGIGPTVGHIVRVHHTFDDSGNFGLDDTGNGNDISCGSGWGAGEEFSTDAIAGGGAIQFFGSSSMTPCNPSPTFTTWREVLAGSFTFSAWVNTTASRGEDTEDAISGATLFWAYNDHSDTNDTIPISITGSKAAFTTRNHLGNSETLHSITSVNDGNYHLITVTRDGATGQKKVYVDGNLEGTASGTTEPLNGNDYYLSIGGTFLSSYSGLLDDAQIYSGVLSDSDVAYLYDNPGLTVPNLSSVDFNPAINTTNLSWTTGGNAFWFVESTNTHGTVSAAQAGAIGDNQDTWIETTVIGPGTLSFWWQVSSQGGSDELAFLLDGNVQTGISGDSGWQQQSYSINSGMHTLRWRYAKDGCCTDFLDTAFLDQVSFANSGPPLTFSLTITRQAFASYQPFATGQTLFYAFPGLSGSDTPISYHRVESPNNTCSANFGPTNGGAGASIFSTFDELANSLTNGNWKLWLNKETPQEQLYTFTVSANSFTSNSLAAVRVLAPLDGATGVLTNPLYQWTGPAGWSNLNVHAWQERFGTNHDYAFANLPTISVSWPGGPVLTPGTNFFDVQYQRTSLTNFVISAPYPEWSVGDITYQSAATAGFLVGGAIAQPVTLVNLHNTGGALQFQFLSQVSFTHAVQYRTNLVTGSNWQTYTNVAGDGTLKTITVPYSVFSPAQQGLIRVSTQ